jgi:hypothetical protein
MLISEQVLTLGYRYDPDEHRNRFGVWESDAEYWHDTGTDYKDPDKGRLVNPRGRPPDPADHPFFKVHPVSAENVMASYDRSGAATRQQGMRWYADAHTVAKALAHGDADKGAGVLAAYSPQTGWPANMLNAARALELGRAIGPGEGMITKDMQAHAQRAIDGAKADEANTSSKTKAFARLIRNGGDSPDDAQGDVVVDRHAMTVAMGQRLPKTEADKAPIGNDRYYQHVADAYREAARRISERDGTPIAPHQIQAITWLQQQGENEAIDAASGTALNKGRASMIRNAWNQWGATAKAEEIPTYPGTTMLDASSLISSQVMDFGHWDGWRTEPRDSRGRWTRFGGVGEAVRVMEKEREGFSVSPHSGDAPQSGYMVALDGHTHRYPAEILDDPDRLHKAIDDMLMSERESFQGKDMYLGGWVEDGKLWLDPSQNVQDRSTAEQMGKARDQVGIFDLQNFSTINTGGSGGGRIIDHQLANPAEGPRGGSRGILGHARGRAPGRGSEDRRRYQGGIAAQLGYVELAWRDQPRGTHGEWVPEAEWDAEHPWAKQALRGRGSAGSQVTGADAGPVRDLVTKTAASVPLMFNPDDHLDWDGRLPTLYDDAARPGVLAEVDWDGHVNMAQSVADGIREAVSNPDSEIPSPENFSVPLHEMIHAVLPRGETRRTNGDMQAYQDLPHADIEEGFTELGTIQHAGEYFDKIGVGDRSLDPFMYGEDTVTMHDLAGSLNSPDRIRNGDAWGHYARQTSQAFAWASVAAQMRTGRPESDPQTLAEIQRIADEVNAVGTRAKPLTMAMIEVGDMLPADPVQAQRILDASSSAILGNWGSGVGEQAHEAARQAAQSALQRLQAERTAA